MFGPRPLAVPEEHVLHAVAACSLAALPASQVAQEDEPGDSEYVPTAHGEHEVASAAEYQPASH